MTKFVETIIIGAGTFVLSVFLPKQLVSLFRELIKFIFNSLIKYWYLSFSIIIVIFFINLKSDCVYFGDYTSLRFILIETLSVLVIVPSVAILRELLKTYYPNSIALYGCFSVKENEYVTIDIDSEDLNIKIEKII